MLSKNSIARELKRGNIVVDNSKENLRNGFINVTLGNTLKVYEPPFLDVSNSSPTTEIVIPEEGYILKPNELYLGCTNEFTKTYGFVPLLSGTEELAAIGMEIHITAGFGDHGFEGTWTLEIVCTNPTKVYPGMPIGRIQYYPLIGDANIQYKGKYFRQVKPTASKLGEEYGEKKRVRSRNVNE